MPGIAEVIFWIVCGMIGIGIMIASAIFNPFYDPKGNDPYRYCPKEEKE